MDARTRAAVPVWFAGDGGADTPENAACLCPAHHREIHYGKEAAVLRGKLREARARERLAADKEVG